MLRTIPDPNIFRHRFQRIAVIAAACLLSSIVPRLAFAQNLVIDFTTPNVITLPGTSQVGFFGTLTNTGTETLNLNGDSNQITPDLPITSHFFDSDFPISLAAGESVSNIHFFDVDTSLALPDVYTGSYQILAKGASGGTSIASTGGAYTITVVVPEASSGLLSGCAAFLFASLYYLAHLRRNRDHGETRKKQLSELPSRAMKIADCGLLQLGILPLN